MARLDDLEFHGGCDDMYCSKCQKVNAELTAMMYDALGNSEDWLGKYHSWLGKQGIQPETAGGWWTREALRDKNAQRFIEEHAG